MVDRFYPENNGGLRTISRTAIIPHPMIALKYLDRIERLHHLIKRKATGTPKELANRLEVSEASVYEYIKTLKEMGAPVAYDIYRKSYVYDRPCSLSLRYNVEVLEEDEIKYAQAGYYLSGARQPPHLFSSQNAGEWLPHYFTIDLTLRNLSNTDGFAC